jgi:glycerate kinase
VRVLVAPDKFKGSLGAAAVGEAMARGVRRAAPAAAVTVAALADGGEGTTEALTQGLGGELHEVTVTGPLGDEVRACFARLSDGRVALEMSAASGLGLVAPERLDALSASSFGTGELLRAALGSAADAEVVVGIGGSASTDGGAGAAAAVGWRFLDRRGRPLPPGGGALQRLARIDPGGVDPAISAATIVGASDVGNRLLGPDGAARVFGPQKGASAEDVARLEDGLARLAERTRADLGLDVATRWGSGASGGLGAGLMAFFGAALRPGFDVVAEAVGLPGRLEVADVVMTGEGRLDAGSLTGKAPVGVARLAAARAVPCLVVAGRIDLAAERWTKAGFSGAAALVDVVGERRALADPTAAITATTEDLLRRHLASRSPP